MKTCREVTTMISSDTLAQSNWRERMGVKLHLMMCRHCNRYAAQLHTIASEARHLYAELPSVSDLEQSILKALGRK